MTETPHQPPPQAPPEGQPAPPEPSTGWNTQHLKDYRQMRRSRDNRKVAGVAGGLARHLDVDPTVIRVLFVVLIFFGGSGLLLYAALWLLVPEEGTDDAVIGTSESVRNALLITALVIAGLLALGDSWDGYGGFPWPLAIVALIVVAVLMSRDRRSTGSSVPPGAAPAYPAATAATPPRTRRTGPLLFGVTLALIALAVGLLGLYDAAGNPVVDAAYPALALTVTGAMLVLGAFYGRAGGLILIGVASAVALGGAAVTNPSYDGERDLVVRPTSGAALQDSYAVPAGRIEVDLTDLGELEELDGRRLDLSANAGEILVRVPRDLDVTYTARIEYAGAIMTPEGGRDGWDSVWRGAVRGDDAVAEMHLDIDLNVGHIELRQQ
jgi:phage shock protein PspC (stress-responsive transcriptional regulator)